MSTMNFKDWPVAYMDDFEEITVDVTRWDNGLYNAAFNFHKEYSDDGNEGFTLCTQVVGGSIRELYDKITDLIMLGIFDGSNVQAHGNLYDTDHNELATICWHQYSDDEWDDENDDSQGLTYVDEPQRVKVTTTHSAPAMIH